jgi:hypothetical protein
VSFLIWAAWPCPSSSVSFKIRKISRTRKLARISSTIA